MAAQPIMESSASPDTDEPKCAGKRKRHEISCPHKDRKHYAKVPACPITLRICAATVITIKVALKRLGCALILIRHTTLVENVRRAIFSSITRTRSTRGWRRWTVRVTRGKRNWKKFQTPIKSSISFVNQIYHDLSLYNWCITIIC